MKIVAVMWDSLQPLMESAFKSKDIKVYANRVVDSSDDVFDDVIESMKVADLIILYRTTHSFWEKLIPEVKKLVDKKIICVGQDPMYWSISTVEPEECSAVYSYLLNGNKINFQRLLDYIDMRFGDRDILALPPVSIPWQGIVHPEFQDVIFTNIGDYVQKYVFIDGAPWVALIISRSAWVSEQRSIEEKMIKDLESEGMNVIPIMTNSLHNEETGSKNIAECIQEFLLNEKSPKIDAMIKMVTFMIGKVPNMTSEQAAKASEDILKEMNIPVFQPIISYGMSTEEWTAANTLSSDISWGIAMPEFEGMIEPIIIGTTRGSDNEQYSRNAIEGRCGKVARRIAKWVGMKRKAESERKVVLVLNNNPCASVEANIGSAAGLDAIRSTVNVLKELRSAGYSVSVPKDAEDLMRAFNERKAISEFRWTSASDIVSSGGAIYRMSADEYRSYFDTLPEIVREKMVSTWGEPPGQSMTYEGDIIITGLKCGNAIIAVQPKRGCFGAKCDGTVCKILHDPDCPPTHQYVATYHYFRDIFAADALIHVGTHGTMEFLPGKGTGLSETCYPDICIGDTPMIYLYNTDNPPEGSIAKRRCYSTLIGHMQTAMSSAGLYDSLLKLDNLLAQYETAGTDNARKHALHHMILGAVKEAHLDYIGVDHETPIEEAIRKCHEALTRIRTSKIEVGMHTFGDVPDGKKLIDIVSSVVRYDAGRESTSPRRLIAKMFGVDYSLLLSQQDGFCRELNLSNGAAIEWIDDRVGLLVKMVINGAESDDIADALGRSKIDGFDEAVERISGIVRDIRKSDEMGSLKNSLSGGFILPGPSGYMTRGREDIFPTGRNFYSLDPKRIPTTSSWRVGSRLADALIDKYRSEEGNYPDSVAFQWMTGDIMVADGEMMAEIFSLIGVEPVWQSNGHVEEFKIIPLDELRHPRIDVTIRISGILRDNFPGCVDLVDEAISAVANLDEPSEMNHIRKHVLAETDNGTSFSDATARIFSSKPGTYTSGVNHAILSGAWKDEKDLAEIYIATNGYSYGRKRGGVASHVQFASGLESVSVTFNKVVTDEHDLLGCCCYYSNQGGMTAAAKHLSGKDVKAYYGDTRETEVVEVRTLADEIRRVTRSKLLNPAWIDGMKEHGYKGAADMMKKITRVYGWEASTQVVDDDIFDDIADKYINDSKMRQFFRDNNPYAAEEISRRLLEAEQRGLWDANPDTLDNLRDNYVEIESWMEELSGDGDSQGGSVSIMSPEEIDGYGKDLEEIMKKVHGRKK